jgi:signal transduction histidine kinase
MAHKNGSIIRLENQKTQSDIERLERISHDFRSPLNIIIGFSELLLAEVPGKINDEQKHSLNDILNSSYRLLRLVNETFDPSLPDSKKILNS